MTRWTDGGRGFEVDVYYNEHDRHAAQWLRNLMADGLIPEGVVDERDIQAVKPENFKGFRVCHFFAGIGGWASGNKRSGSSVRMGKRGVLNPALSLWLMGFPSAWLMAAPVKERRVRGSSKASAMPSSHNSRPNS